MDEKLLDIIFEAIRNGRANECGSEEIAEDVLTALRSSNYMVIEGWKPIETAPRENGNRVIGYGVCGLDDLPGPATVEWNEFRKEWWASPNEASEYNPEACKLTHWMPLPSPPSKEDSNG